MADTIWVERTIDGYLYRANAAGVVQVCHEGWIAAHVTGAHADLIAEARRLGAGGKKPSGSRCLDCGRRCKATRSYCFDCRRAKGVR